MNKKSNIYYLLFPLIFIVCLVSIRSIHYYKKKSYSSILIEPVLNINSQNVVCVVITPRKISTKRHLVLKRLQICNKEFISEICNGLKKAYKYSPNHPSTYWTCLFTLETKSVKYSFKIINSLKNGVLINFYSNKEEGWCLGTYRSDLLGTVIEKQLKDMGLLRNFRTIK